MRCDYTGNIFIHFLLDDLFGQENYRNEILVRRGAPKQAYSNSLKKSSLSGVTYDNLYWYSKLPRTTYSQFLKLSSELKNMANGASFKKIYDRPNLRYEILGVSLEKGQWMGPKEKAFKAVANYQQYLAESQQTGESLRRSYWDRLGRSESYIRKSGLSIQYWVAPRETVLC